MYSRRKFLSTTAVAGSALAISSQLAFSNTKERALGLQLYTFREQMQSNPLKTLEEIASLGIKKIESAKSQKGHYYGLKPQEMQTACTDLGMQLVSGHVHLDDAFDRTLEEAVEAQQAFLICSSLPTNGQTLDNYKRVAEAFNKAGEKCMAAGLRFGYHNHEYEFESENGTVLYDVIMDETEANLVHMELDLGWVIVAEKNPLDYFKKYPGRFPLWHLKDMDLVKKHSTEFGKGGLNIPEMLAHQNDSGVEHIFIEQEEYATTPFESIQHNMHFMKTL
jgi:sugar phosphate isomerase/epimerase